MRKHQKNCGSRSEGMRQANLSPKQFGLYIKAHPDSLLITAPNKMRSGKPVKVKQNFSARLIESYILPVNMDSNQENEKLIAEYWQSGFGGCPIEPTGKGWTAQDVPVGVIEKFLIKFVTHPSFTERKFHAIEYLRRLSDKYPRGDILLISLQENGEDPAQYRLGMQKRESADRKENGWRMSKDRVASRGDEKLGLTQQQKDAAVSMAEEDGKKEPSDIHFRMVRNKPLLMIHVIEPKEAQQRVPAFGISFPANNYETEIEVMANTVWMKQMYDISTDSPDQEVDYDE